MIEVTPTTTKVWLDFLTPAMIGLVAWINVWAANRAARKTEAVRRDLVERGKATDDKLDCLTVVTDETHKLVDGGKRHQLAIYATAVRALAELTHKPEYIAAAAAAERELAAHMEQERRVDGKEKDEA